VKPDGGRSGMPLTMEDWYDPPFIRNRIDL